MILVISPGGSIPDSGGVAAQCCSPLFFKKEKLKIKEKEKERKRKMKMKEKEQHTDFARGPPPHYYPCQNVLDFADQTGCGILTIVWPFVSLVIVNCI